MVFITGLRFTPLLSYVPPPSSSINSNMVDVMVFIMGLRFTPLLSYVPPPSSSINSNMAM